MYDLIIVGAGPAGITASVYAVRKRMNLLVISEDIGGQAALSGDIENYTGYQFISGPDLAAKFEEHIDQYGIEVKEFERVEEVLKANDHISIKTNKSAYQSKSLIIASGKRSRELNVLGENEFKNKGLTFCATCDGPLFSGKDVAVIGGGNSALDAVIGLVKIVNRIYLINNSDRLGGDRFLREKIEGDAKVIVLNNTDILEVLGGKFVSGVRIKQKGVGLEVGSADSLLKVEGVFVEIGLIPNSEFAKGVKKNEKNEIVVDAANRTSIEGVFAAGDVTDVLEKQIIIAAGEGAKAALEVFKYLSRREA